MWCDLLPCTTKQIKIKARYDFIEKFAEIKKYKMNRKYNNMNCDYKSYQNTKFPQAV